MEGNKKLIKIGLIVGALIFMVMLALKTQGAETDYYCGDGTITSGSYVNPACNDPIGTHYYEVKGKYTDYESAYAAAVSGKAELEAMFAVYNISAVDQSLWAGDNPDWDTSIWGHVRATIHSCHDPGATGTHYNWYYLYILPGWVDEDVDCSNDYAGTCELECYTKWKGWKDGNGDFVWLQIVTTEGRTIEYGSRQDVLDCLSGVITGCEEFNNYLAEYDLNNADPEICDNTCNISTIDGLSPASDSPTDQIVEMPLPEPEKGTEGQDSEVTDTDNELLQKITDNTSETADNTDGIEEGLTEIEKQLILANQKLDAISNNPSGSGTSQSNTPSAADQGRLDALNNVENMTTEEAEGYGFTESDYLVETTIQTFLDNLLADNPAQEFIDKLQITASNPACSIEDSFMFYSTEIDIELSLCEFETGIDIMGLIVLLLAGITFVRLIFNL